MATPADSARGVAFEVLRAVDEHDAYANLELSRRLANASLSREDAALATELCNGTLRLRGSYDLIIDQLVNRSLDPPVRDALRLGTHQLLSMRVPDHAAVSTTVDLVKQRIGFKPSSLVNAVLRKISARTLTEWLAGRSLAERYSHPDWVVAAFAEALDRPDELEALLAADNEPPAVSLVALPGLATTDELGGRTSDISPIGVTMPSGDPASIPAVRAGRAGVQDAGSQLVALLLTRAEIRSGQTEPDASGASETPKKTPRWLDLCAGPGGKAAVLAAEAARTGCTLLAVERHPHRAVLVASALRALPDEVAQVVIADGTTPGWRPESFDRILVDAPCSGLGALRRRPESRWRRTPGDLTALLSLQTDLLMAAIDSVRPGGIVVYATCSPVVAETAGVVTSVLRDRGDVRLEPAGSYLPEVTDAASAHLPEAVQLWPHRHGTDAMFMALLRKSDPSAL